MATAISASFFFLQHDPYHVLFNPPEGLEKSNLNLQQVNNIIVNDVRELDSLPTIEKNGFTLIKIDTGLLTSDEFDDNQKVANIFLQRAAAATQLKLMLKA
ncbi:hypothetical protein Trisim1_009753 [Trichoderma cf. simile WF8]